MHKSSHKNTHRAEHTQTLTTTTTVSLLLLLLLSLLLLFARLASSRLVSCVHVCVCVLTKECKRVSLSIAGIGCRLPCQPLLPSPLCCCCTPLQCSVHCTCNNVHLILTRQLQLSTPSELSALVDYCHLKCRCNLLFFFFFFLLHSRSRCCNSQADLGALLFRFLKHFVVSSFSSFSSPSSSPSSIVLGGNVSLSFSDLDLFVHTLCCCNWEAPSNFENSINTRQERDGERWRKGETLIGR